MATAKRLPSGSYRVRVFSHTDEKGKKHQVSFTAPTKREAEMMAAEWANKKDRRKKSDLTIGEAIDGYIEAKEGVLSPSTIRGYVRMRRNNYSSIERISLKKITSETLQHFVSDLARTMSAKSVHNVYALLSSAISLYEPDISFRVTLPAKQKKKLISPSDDDVVALFKAASPQIKICIALAAFGSLRRGEVCALKYEDIDRENNTVSVHADIVQDKGGKWVYKEMPKTSESYRTVKLPPEIIALIDDGEPGDYIIKYSTPNSLSRVFLKLRTRLGLNEISYHGLRHYYASIGAVLGIPDNFLADFGGWRNDSPIMKNTYQNKIIPMAELYAAKMAAHFSSIIEE